MASNWSNLGLRLMTTGENDNTWGGQTNDNWNRMEDSTDGYMSVALSSTSHTATFTTQPTSYADEEGRQRVINYTGSPGGTCTVTLPNIEKVYVIRNNTDQSLILTAGTGAATVTLASGFDAQVYVDGSDEVNNCFDQMTGSVPTTSQVVTALSGATLTGALTIDNDLTLQGAAANIVFDESDNALEFATNAKAKFGSANDLEIYSDGTNSYISESGGSGNLKLQGQTVRLEKTDGEIMLEATNDGAVDLYHDGTKIISTTASGLANNSGDFVLDVVGDISLDAGGGDIVLGDDGTQFGSLTNSSSNLIIKSGSTTAATFSGANVTFAGTLASGAITSSGNITAYSDQQLKSDIKTIDNALDKVSQMRGVTFIKDDKQSSGVIAQEMEKIAPELVIDGEYKSVAYGNIVGYLIEAVKELKVELETHKKNCHCKEE
ncbi:MAG: hypothetical protein CML36_01590 [Rhodobacteraceae bacterium]|nr:hypothetical protein [Paracoccaceae bacterium]